MNDRVGRRRFLGAGLAGTATGLAGCGQLLGSSNAGNQPLIDGSLPDSVRLRQVAGGFDAPLALVDVPDADLRYVADQSGSVSVLDSDGVRDDPLLEFGNAVEFGGEKGLLGVALHPNFEETRRLFVRYSAPSRDGTPENFSHTFVLAEFLVDESGLQALPDSERTLLEIPEPQSNHNAGALAFGPDNNLYVAVGDGGAGADAGLGHADDWYDAVEGGNGQDVTENLLGSLLRIDVDADSERGAYSIPDDNPLTDADGLAEQYAWGFRNPWRFSFDGDALLVADVGQSEFEEVNLVERGGNYGWNVREGSRCFRADDCPTETPESVRGGEPLVDPVVEYAHGGDPVDGVAVVGGYVYRGSALSDLDGRYVFADLRPDGRLFVADPSGPDERWPMGTVEMDADGGVPDQIYSLGRGRDGELFVFGIEAGDGRVYRVDPAE
ncbi:PQQ-dependent sugar dehydrogenase [Natronoarchaeum mannanilyticum]|uniref:Glucose/Sorbosone dehydrogenase domain-containing protein n=1 Tax=Natronoarchaeum mannanilyticum TaxID=926360 RepID=A0AAV3TCJ8_9EURY